MLLLTGLAGTAERRAALRLLTVAPDDALPQLFAGRLLEVMDEGVPTTHELRADLDGLLARRFEGGRSELAAGLVRPLRYRPAGVFTPELFGVSARRPAPGGMAEADLEQVAAALERSDEQLVRLLGQLPPVQVARGRWWLRQARAVLAVTRYLSGDPAHDLPIGSIAPLLPSLLAGPAPWAALRLLRAVDDDELARVLASAPWLPAALERHIPPGHDLRAELDALLEARVEGGSWALAASELRPRPSYPPQAFRPGLISPRLDGLPVRAELAPEEAALARSAIEGRPDAELAQTLAPLPPVQRARAAWWLGRVRAAAGWADQVRAWLSGDPAAELTADELRKLIMTLVTGGASLPERALALVVLQSSGDAMLGRLFSDPELARVIDAGIGEGHPLRGDLTRFFGQRFHGGLKAVADGQVRPREVYPQEDFAVDQIDARPPGGLSPQQRAAATWQVARQREAAGWADQARAYLSGDPAADLTVQRHRDLIIALVTGLASDEEQSLALHLLRSASDAELSEIVGPDLLRLLEEGIPDGHHLRPELNSFLEGRFRGGRNAVASGQVVPQGQLDGTFTPMLLGSELATADLTAELAGEQLDRVVRAFSGWSSADLAPALLALPAAQRARAAWWLTRVRVAVHDHYASPPPALVTVDRVLDDLYRAAARDVLSRDRLRQLTMRPPSAQAPALRAALERPSRRAPDEAQGGARPARAFQNQLPGQPGDFAARLGSAYAVDLAQYTSEYVVNRGAAARAVPGSLYSMEHIADIARLAKDSVDAVFGHLATGPVLVPDRPGIGGNIHDQWAYWDKRFERMSPDELRAEVRMRLIAMLGLGDAIAEALRVHHAAPDFGPAGEPRNTEALIVSAVIDGLLDSERFLSQMLDFVRGFPAESHAGIEQIWLQVLRAATLQQNQRTLWDTFQILLHEYLHLLEHSQYIRYREQLGFGTHAYNALVEGVVSLLTETAWSAVVLPEARGAVEGGYAHSPALPPDQMPHPACRRYPSMAEVMRLIQMVGLPNLLAAFFLGDVTAITGLPAPAGPPAPLTGREVAAEIARLNALLSAEPRLPLISLFAGEDVERQLTVRGADFLAGWSRDLGPGPSEPLRQLAEPGGWPADSAEDVAAYTRARLAHSAAVTKLQEFRDRHGSPSTELEAEARLQAAVTEAQRQLTRTEERLAAWGITNPEQVWQQVTEQERAAPARGLPGGARVQVLGRGRGRRHIVVSTDDEQAGEAGPAESGGSEDDSDFEPDESVPSQAAKRKRGRRAKRGVVAKRSGSSHRGGNPRARRGDSVSMRVREIADGAIEEWWALSEEDRFELQLLDLLEHRLAEEGEPGLVFKARSGNHLQPWVADSLRRQIPRLLLTQDYVDASLARLLGVGGRSARIWRRELGLVRQRDFGLVDPLPREPVMAEVVGQWQELPDSPLLPMLERRLNEVGRSVRQRRGYADGIPEALYFQAMWLLERGDYSADALGARLGVGADIAGVWRRELVGVEPDDPIVAEVVAQWRALPEGGRLETPLLGMLESRLTEAGRPIRRTADVFVPGAMRVMRRQIPWLLERGSYSDDQLAAQLGITSPRARGMRRAEGQAMGAVRPDERLVVDVVRQWRTGPEAGRLGAPLLGLLEQSLATEGRHVYNGRKLAPGVNDILRSQVEWLRNQHDYTDTLLARQLGTSESTVARLRIEAGLRPAGSSSEELRRERWSAEELSALAANPWLDGADEMVQLAQVRYLIDEARYVAESAAHGEAYGAFWLELSRDRNRWLAVEADGDCFFNSLLMMAGSHLSRFFGGREPTVQQMRDAIAAELERSYDAYWQDATPEAAQGAGLSAAMFPDLLEGSEPDRGARLRRYAGWIRTRGQYTWQVTGPRGQWNVGDSMVNIAANLWELPLRVLGRNVAMDIGPASGRAVGYLLYDGSHYMGLTYGDADPAPDVARQRPAEAVFRIPGAVPGQVLAARLGAAFARLHEQVAHAVDRAEDPGLLNVRLAERYEDFRDAHEAAVLAENDTAFEQQIGRMSLLHQAVGGLLREVADSAPVVGPQSARTVGPSGDNTSLEQSSTALKRRPAAEGQDEAENPFASGSELTSLTSSPSDSGPTPRPSRARERGGSTRHATLARKNRGSYTGAASTTWQDVPCSLMSRQAPCAIGTRRRLGRALMMRTWRRRSRTGGRGFSSGGGRDNPPDVSRSRCFLSWGGWTSAFTERGYCRRSSSWSRGKRGRCSKTRARPS